MTPLIVAVASLSGGPLAHRANENLARHYARFTPLMGPMRWQEFRVESPATRQGRLADSLAALDELVRILEKSRDELKAIDPKAAAGHDEQIEKWKARRAALQKLADR